MVWGRAGLLDTCYPQQLSHEHTLEIVSLIRAALTQEKSIWAHPGLMFTMDLEDSFHLRRCQHSGLHNSCALRSDMMAL
ncbi:hypothetical protein XENOCAPTIV_027265 [Xenoophorus captivus]|uniref:Uncharacterized protein n=1 Tax=Xenoophorus captivus TaxID=1517983 RepID=A0ABV0QX12_9TELE